MDVSEELIPTRWSLLSRLKDAADAESWQEFFDIYWRLIYRAATKSGLTDAEAQEVVQGGADQGTRRHARERAAAFIVENGWKTILLVRYVEVGSAVIVVVSPSDAPSVSGHAANQVRCDLGERPVPVVVVKEIDNTRAGVAYE